MDDVINYMRNLENNNRQLSQLLAQKAGALKQLRYLEREIEKLRRKMTKDPRND